MYRTTCPKWRLAILLTLTLFSAGCASKSESTAEATASDEASQLADSHVSPTSDDASVGGNAALGGSAEAGFGGAATAESVGAHPMLGAQNAAPWNARSNSGASVGLHTGASSSAVASGQSSGATGFAPPTSSAGGAFAPGAAAPRVTMSPKNSSSNSSTLNNQPTLQSERSVAPLPANPLRERTAMSAASVSSAEVGAFNTAGQPRRFPEGTSGSASTSMGVLSSDGVLTGDPLPNSLPEYPIASAATAPSPVAPASVMPAAAEQADLDLPPGAHAVTVRFATDRLPLVELLPNTIQIFTRTAAVTLVLCGLSIGCFLVKRFRPLWMIACAAATTLLVLTLHADVVRMQQVHRLAQNNQSVFTTERYEAGPEYPLHLGEAIVSLPPKHEKGGFESVSIAKFEFVETPGKHIVLHKVSVDDDVDHWFSEIGQEVAASGDGHMPPLANGSGAFIFVHGYNVRFDDALKRTAQLSYDLNIAGPAICYSWPSKGNVAGYSADESTVNWSAPHLEQLILDLREQAGVKSINLIAHSMGNRALLQAVERLHLRSSNEKEPEPIIDRLVMAAPDVDAQAFSGRYSESLEGAVAQSTLYFSSADRALWLSRLLHGGKRVGLDVVTNNVNNLEAIDIGPQAFFSTGHSYYGSDPVVIDDLSSVLREHASAANRPWLVRERVASAEFWMLDRQRHATATQSITR